MSISPQELAQKFAGLLGVTFAPATDPAPAASAEGVSATAPGPIQVTDYNAKGYHLDVNVTPAQLTDAAKLLEQHGFAPDTVTGVDWMANDQMEVVYDFYHPGMCFRAVVRTRVPRSQPEVPTISRIFPGADWHERETHDFFGIRFLGHPDLSPLLLPEDADYHPLRKDFTA